MPSLESIKVRVPDVAYFARQVLCREGCPVSTDAGGYVRAIAEGRFGDAYRIAREPNPFASICGRICNAPCELRCRRGALDETISIRALKRFVCERFGVESGASPVRPPAAAQEGRVAVVGGGPAGLACAHDLALAGHPVAVLEAAPRPGGMLTLGIPEYRLPRELIEAEIDAILNLGVELRTGQRLGTDFTVDDLFADGFEAVFLGIGAHRSRNLDVDGADLDGVLPAIDYLLNHHLGYRIDLGPRVVVIGGGNVALDAARSALRHAKDPEEMEEAELRRTLRQARDVFRVMSRRAKTDNGDAPEMQVAFDAARQALRAGVEDVDVYCLEAFHEMPASGHEVEDAVEERVEIHPSWGPRRILGKDGKVVGVELVKVLSVFDDTGRFHPVFDEEETRTVPADTVILAIGQTPDLSWLRPEDGLETTPRGTLLCDPDTLATTRPGVYAGGDLAFGARNVIHAVAEGRRAARSICNLLGGSDAADVAPFRYRRTVLPCHGLSETTHRPPRVEPPKVAVDRRVGVTEVERPYGEDTACHQALRCLECHVSPIFDSDLCIACGGCVDVCPEGCLSLVDSARLDGDGVAALLEARYGRTPEAGRYTAILKDETRCIRCGLCAERCPVGAVTMERVEVLSS